MKKNLTELVFILDRSGSMQGLEADTIGGFNSMLKRGPARRWSPPYCSTTGSRYSMTGYGRTG